MMNTEKNRSLVILKKKIQIHAEKNHKSVALSLLLLRFFN